MADAARRLEQQEVQERASPQPEGVYDLQRLQLAATQNIGLLLGVIAALGIGVFILRKVR